MPSRSTLRTYRKRRQRAHLAQEPRYDERRLELVPPGCVGHLLCRTCGLAVAVVAESAAVLDQLDLCPSCGAEAVVVPVE